MTIEHVSKSFLKHLKLSNKETGAIDKETLFAYHALFVQTGGRLDLERVQMFMLRNGGMSFPPRKAHTLLLDTQFKLLFEGDRFNIFKGEHWIYKEAVDVHKDILEKHGFVSEILYGGYLTYLRPDLFEGVVKVELMSKTMLIQHSGCVDLFELWNKGCLNDLQCRMVAVNVIRGAQQMHALGFLHNDIKLENIIVNDMTLMIKFIDFERSNLVSRTVEDNYMCGTFPYTHPHLFLIDELLYERAKRERSSSRREMFVDCKSTWSDAYSVACVVMILLFNYAPCLTNELNQNRSLKHWNAFLFQEHERRVNHMRTEGKAAIALYGSGAPANLDVYHLLVDVISMDARKLNALTDKYSTSTNWFETLIYAILKLN